MFKNTAMEKYNWKEDIELSLMLADTAKAPEGVKPNTLKQYKITVLPVKGKVIVHKYVPDWAVDFLERHYRNREDIKAVNVVQTLSVKI